jgi:CBS domain containing-hemolysin-like protein
VEQTVIEHGYSRIPVYERDLDDVRGFVHAKDLLRVPAAAFSDPLPEALVRPLLVVPESAQVDHLLEQMRRNRNHLALVIDEHGGTAGIVTMEDIVEEVVGEIRDEHDVETEGVRRTSPNWYVVDASLRPAEVERFAGVQLPEGEYDTVSGFVMERIGRIPEVGDRIDEQDWMLRVRSMDGRRVGEVDMMIKRGRERDE